MWKSDNEGIKEETLIQTCRRGRDGQLGRDDSRQGGGLRTGAGKVVTGGPGEVAASRAGKAAAGGAGGPTFACRETWRNNWGVR